MSINFNNTKFLTSSIHYNYPYVKKNSIEIAFVGYSNSGKSTAINYFINKKKISRFSRLPGRTNMINFFSVNDYLRLVDLPGYGYSVNSKYKKKKMYNLIFQYLKFRECLIGIILLIDIRRLLRYIDRKVLQLLQHRSTNIVILLTKCDKINKSDQNKFLYIIKKELKFYFKNIKIFLFSSLYRENRIKILQFIMKWI